MPWTSNNARWLMAVLTTVVGIIVLITLIRPSPPPPAPPPRLPQNRSPQESNEGSDGETKEQDIQDLQVFDRSGRRAGKSDLKGVVLNPQKPESAANSKWPRVAVPSTAIDALKLLRDLDRSGSGRDREGLAAAMAEMLRKDPARLQELIASLQGLEDFDLRRFGLIVLGRVDRPEATQALLEVARQAPDRDSRIVAVRAIFQNGKGSAHEVYAGMDFRPLAENTLTEDRVLPLMNLLKQERDHEVFQCLVESLSKYQDAKVTQGNSEYSEITRTVVDLLRAERDPDRIRDLFLSFAYTRSAVARDAIFEKLGSLTDPNLVAQGVQALGYQTETTAALDLKLKYVMDPSESVRKKALEALSNSSRGRDDGSRVADQIGQSVMADVSRLVRIAGAGTLGTCGDAGRPYLQKMADGDPDPQVRSTARQWLDRKR